MRRKPMLPSKKEKPRKCVSSFCPCPETNMQALEVPRHGNKRLRRHALTGLVQIASTRSLVRCSSRRALDPGCLCPPRSACGACGLGRPDHFDVAYPRIGRECPGRHGEIDRRRVHVSETRPAKGQILERAMQVESSDKSRQRVQSTISIA
jgi:hypothetical protein